MFINILQGVLPLAEIEVKEIHYAILSIGAQLNNCCFNSWQQRKISVDLIMKQQ